VSLNVPQGGYYLWLTLPENVDGDALARAAEAAGVHIIPGTKFFAGTGPGSAGERVRARNHIRLSYSYATFAQIDEGIRRLARVYAG
jgi:2-aminoadipate transaminase